MPHPLPYCPAHCYQDLLLEYKDSLRECVIFDDVDTAGDRDIETLNLRLASLPEFPMVQDLVLIQHTNDGMLSLCSTIEQYGSRVSTLKAIIYPSCSHHDALDIELKNITPFPNIKSLTTIRRSFHDQDKSYQFLMRTFTNLQFLQISEIDDFEIMAEFYPDSDLLDGQRKLVSKETALLFFD